MGIRHTKLYVSPQSSQQLPLSTNIATTIISYIDFYNLQYLPNNYSTIKFPYNITNSVQISEITKLIKKYPSISITGITLSLYENETATPQKHQNNSCKTLTDFTTSSLANINIKHITINRANTTTLSFLQTYQNLKTLIIEYNPDLQDATTLQQLTNLRHITIYNCYNTQNFPPLPPNLRSFYCNEIHDFSILNTCPKLRSLKIFNSNITNIIILTNPPKLKKLALTSCHMLQTIDNIQFYKNLKKITLNNCQHIKNIDQLTHNKITHIHLTDCRSINSLIIPTNLKYLIIKYCASINITINTPLPQIKHIHIDNCNSVSIKSHHTLINCPNLTHISITNTLLKLTEQLQPQLFTTLKKLIITSSISNITSLQSCINLTSLNLSSNLINDITPLSQCTNLTSLNLSLNPINDITPLSQCTNLTSLNLSSNLINDITPLSQCTNLKYLYIQNASLNSITPLQSCTALEHLFIINSLISNINPLSNCTNLTSLNLSLNPIKNITSLSRCINLKDIILYNTLVSDASPLNECPVLKHVDLRESPFIPMFGKLKKRPSLEILHSVNLWPSMRKE